MGGLLEHDFFEILLGEFEFGVHLLAKGVAHGLLLVVDSFEFLLGPIHFQIFYSHILPNH